MKREEKEKLEEEKNTQKKMKKIGKKDKTEINGKNWKKKTPWC